MLPPQKNQFPVVKVVFEGRKEATRKHVLLQQQQLTVCKQVEEGNKSGKIEENRE